MSVPDAPTITSQLLVVNSTTVTVEFTLGFNGGSDLTDIQYARSTDGYTVWTTLNLSTPLEGYTSATISDLLTAPYGYFALRAVNTNGESVASNTQSALSAVPPLSSSNWLSLNSNSFTAVSYDSTGQYIAAINSDGQFQRSSDYGLTFQTTGPTLLPMTSFAISANRTSIYVCGADNQVYRSTDSGASFIPVTTGYEGTAFTSMISSAIGDYIFAVSNTGSDVVLTTVGNAGTPWSNQGAMSVYWNNIVCSENGNYVFAVGRDTVTDENVMYKSINYGASWDIVPSFTDNPTSRLNRVACDTTGQYVDVAAGLDGLYRSEDYGTTWVHLDAGGYGLDWISIATSGVAGVNLIAGEATHNSVYTSDDAGATWTLLNMNLSVPVMVAVDPSGTYRLTSASGAGTLINQFPSAVTSTWDLQNGYYYTKVAIASDNLHIAAVEYIPSTDSNNIAISSDGGVTWTSSAAPNAGNVAAIVSSSSGQIIYMMENTNGVVYRSEDYGVVFSQLTNAPIDGYSIACSSDGVYVFIGTTIGKVYTSSDSGANFTEEYSDITEQNVLSMSCSTSGQYVYATYNYTVAISSDYGLSFNTASVDEVNINKIVSDQTGQYLFAATSNGVYRSINYGANWTLLTGLTGDNNYIVNNNTGIRAVVYNSTANAYYRTFDSGVTWYPITLVGSNINTGLGDYNSSISPDGSLYVLSARNPGTYFTTDTSIDAPVFTSMPVIVNNTTITIEFALGYNGGSALTDIQYARSGDGYTTWTSLGLSAPLEGQTSAIISGLVSNPYGSYKLRAVNVNGNSLPSAAITVYSVFNGEYYPKVVFSSNNQYAIARTFNDGGIDEVAVSSDSGVTWTVIIPPGSVNCMDVAMNVDGTHMYYTSSEGVYHSTDYGVNFLQLMAAPLFVFSIACDSTGQTVYCPSDADANMYVSTDAGAIFTQTAFLGFTPTSIACNASGVYVYAVSGYTVLVSSNSGTTFTLTTTLSEIISLIVCDQTGERVYVSTNAGVLCSVNYGTSFVLTSHPAVDCYNIAIDSLGNRLISLAVDGTTRYSYDAGTTWAARTITGQSLTFTVGGVSISPDGTRYASSVGAPGTYITSEGTADVAPIWTVRNNTCYFDGAISTNNQYIIMPSYDIDTNASVVAYSSDAGATWNETVDFGYVGRIVASASGQIALAIVGSQLPYLSTNYGATFDVTTLTLVGTDYPSYAVINSTGTSMLTIAPDGYVYISTDSGVIWTNPYQFSSTYYINNLCASSSLDRIYTIAYLVSTNTFYIYVSTDMGTTWVSTGVSPVGNTTYSIACDWSGQNVILSSNGGGGGIYRSTNGGVSWTHITYPGTESTTFIASNSTGNRILVIEQNDFIRVSLDAGTTWSTLSTPDAYTNGSYIGAISPDGSRAITSSDYNTYFQPLGAADLPVVPCFLEGSKILCRVNGVDTYVAIETIRPGTLVKTSRDGFKRVKLIGSRSMVNLGVRNKDGLYRCTKAKYPELTEDLTLTGCHAILVDQVTDTHRRGIIKTLERIFVTDKKYRLPACVDERAAVVQTAGTFTVWHFALEHADIKMNYGVYAQGLLVESSPIWHMNTKNYQLVQ